jgi:hypothetical protein
MLGQFNGQTLQQAFQQLPTQAGNQNLDLIQIINPGDNSYGTASPTVLLNVSYDGTVHNAASSPTNGTRLGVFFTTLASGTTAALFASAFSNPSNNDIIQVRNLGGNISYFLDYLGVAHGS